MSAEWHNLPLLPLRCILSHLSMDDALAATSTCRHWRQGMLMYEGRKQSLKLKATDLDKNLFMTRVFRKHVQKLHIYIDCSDDQLNDFMSFVLPMYLDAIKLQEVVFIGPVYVQQNPLAAFSKLKRIITESLVYKHSGFMQKLGILGCELAPVQNENDRFVHKQVEYYAKPLSFTCVTSPEDTLLTRCNVNMMMFSTLRHIVFEYELATQEGIETLSQLKNLKLLSLNVAFKRQMALAPINWERVNARFPKGFINVAVNIINMPHKRFKTVTDNVFVEGMTLTSLKVMFCKTVYIPLISHVCCLYNTTLRELVWVDSPHDGAESGRAVRPQPEPQVLYRSEAYNQVNPFILLCWQCVYLNRLVIHGYWVWQYDLLGFVRLRKNLKMEISSLYANQGRFGSRAQRLECVRRVMRHDAPHAVDSEYIQEVNSYADRGWQPFPWRKLPAALRPRGSREQRAHYVAGEVMHPLGNKADKDK